MSSKTRIIVLHMKEIIYTAVFLALAVVLAVVLFFMFGPGKNTSHTASEKIPLQAGRLYLFHHPEREYLRCGSYCKC